MSNTKRIEIEAVVDYDILQGTDDLELAAALGDIAFQPRGHGLMLDVEECGSRANDRGGVVCQYRVSIRGVEAVSTSYLKRLFNLLAPHVLYPGQYLQIKAWDLEAYDRAELVINERKTIGLEAASG